MASNPIFCYMKYNLLFLISLLAISPSIHAADIITKIPMETNGKAQIALPSGKNLTVRGKHTDENIPGAVGDALRFDGYSTYVTGEIEEFLPEGSMSVTMWVAPETYPIIEKDKATPQKICLAGTLNATTQNGWSFNLGYTGEYSFSFYSDGWPVTIEAEDDLLPCYDWSKLTAVIDMDSKKASLYRNGVKVGEKNTLNTINNAAKEITIGKNAGGAQFGSYFLDTFNGLIDDITVYDGILLEAEIESNTPENLADLSIPASRFEGQIQRPQYHGMPGANWTNETHGMTFHNGKYHLFFQKNANGPYMTRLHWGHLTSENLYDWKEEPIAIAPSEEYDIKGCWSGCVFTDEEITGGVPNIIYTGVDYEKAVMVHAIPLDDNLLEWEKKGVIINGRPSGLSDDFRDPYFFRNGDDAYIIVGTSKDNKGAATLHKYNASSQTWSNDGRIFYQAENVDLEGRFWEMPNITKMDNGKWLFTVTPQGQRTGVHTIYWTGDISADGTFIPDDKTPKTLELISKEGYGLLSPTIYQHEGKTLMTGIVPDKLSEDNNANLGWAHTYSFTREISLDADGNLLQKPYSGLETLRAENGFSKKDFSIDGTMPIEGIGGQQFEVKGVFSVGDTPFGFNFFKNSKGNVTLVYDPVVNQLKLDATSINRMINDKGVYDGVYTATLARKPEPGSEMTLNLFVDGSIVDIFVNDTYATSIRIFPNAKDATGLEVFSNGGTVNVNSLDAWLLGDAQYEDNDSEGENNPGAGDDEDPDAGIDDILSDLPEYVNVYNLNGVPVKSNVKAIEATIGLPKGIYIIGQHKVIVR